MTTPDQDAEHLRLLSVFHYVVGGLMAAFACLPIFHVALGIFMMVVPEKMGHGSPPPSWLGLMFVVMGSLFICVGWTIAALTICGGRCLARRRRHLFCLIVAGISCLWVPFGTVLGVFTILVLSRPAVKASFA